MDLKVDNDEPTLSEKPAEDKYLILPNGRYFAIQLVHSLFNQLVFLFLTQNRAEDHTAKNSSS